MLIKNKIVKPKVENPDTQIRHEKGVRSMRNLNQEYDRRSNQELFYVFGFKNNVQFCEGTARTKADAQSRIEQLKLDKFDKYTKLSITVG
tara:strand:+ start:631 stop:900 length:270 start_codon:yes stop_codon:yes gene_type:complete